MDSPVSSPIYNPYPCSEREGRYRFVVRGRLSGIYVRKYFATTRDAETWADIKIIEATNARAIPHGTANGGADRP